MYTQFWINYHTCAEYPSTIDVTLYQEKQLGHTASSHNAEIKQPCRCSQAASPVFMEGDKKCIKSKLLLRYMM